MSLSLCLSHLQCSVEGSLVFICPQPLSGNGGREVNKERKYGKLLQFKRNIKYDTEVIWFASSSKKNHEKKVHEKLFSLSFRFWIEPRMVSALDGIAREKKCGQMHRDSNSCHFHCSSTRLLISQLNVGSFWRAGASKVVGSVVGWGATGRVLSEELQGWLLRHSPARPHSQPQQPPTVLQNHHPSLFLSMRLGVGPKVGWKWKWSKGVKKSFAKLWLF